MKGRRTLPVLERRNKMAINNKQNRKSRAIVPIKTVEIYGLGIHNGDLMNVMALYNMIVNGIEVVAGVE